MIKIDVKIKKLWMEKMRLLRDEIDKNNSIFKNKFFHVQDSRTLILFTQYLYLKNLSTILWQERSTFDNIDT